MAFWASNPIGTRWPALYSNHSLIVVKNWNCAEKSLGRIGQCRIGLRRIGLAKSVAPNSPIPTFSISIWHKWKWNWQTWNSISQIQFCLPNWVLALPISFPLVPNWYGKGIIRINGYSSNGISNVRWRDIGWINNRRARQRSERKARKILAY